MLYASMVWDIAFQVPGRRSELMCNHLLQLVTYDNVIVASCWDKPEKNVLYLSSVAQFFG